MEGQMAGGSVGKGGSEGGVQAQSTCVGIDSTSMVAAAGQCIALVLHEQRLGLAHIHCILRCLLLLD